MNLKLQEKDASALFLALDETVNFDLKKFSQSDADLINKRKDLSDSINKIIESLNEMGVDE